jgi:hypothetical protein
MRKNVSLKTALKIALAAAVTATMPLQLSHAASDGSLAGKIIASDASSIEGLEITARNPETGFSRTVKAGADGQYRFPHLPVGDYVIEGKRGDSSLGKLAEVTVALGASTTANVTVDNVEEITVVGTKIVTAVDVKSTESATNVTRADLERLPVERDILSVALLAPGLNKGDPDLGGVSFGGSSIAENTVYINGLNVTDFYNRVGNSNVPYAFYKEFQVKTGGYSVEFGRTTGGVINAVTRSGTNEFQFGTEAVWEPSALQSKGNDHFDRSGENYLISSHDEYDRQNIDVYASGPIIKDKLFFFALYEARDYKKTNTNDTADVINKHKADDGFWGAKLDWQISDKHLLELLAFSDENSEATNIYDFDYPSGSTLGYQNTSFIDDGGMNWAVTYTGYLSDSLSMKVLYGENERKAEQNSLNDLNCSRIIDGRSGGGERGCTTTTSVAKRTDTREMGRMDFEWDLGDHQLRFGLDYESNTSDAFSHYPGDRLRYEIFTTEPGATLGNGASVPDGVTAYVRTRQSEVEGVFETINSAYYLEDNWSITSNLILNGGVRVEAFDNRDADGNSYIKVDNMIAPRFGFSWDMRGDNRTKLFGNVGRYFLPVSNLLNAKQAGGTLDERFYYAFEGFTPFEYNGQTYQQPILGAQIGGVDNRFGDGTIGDLRGEVDKDIDPIYQDELILGFQTMIDDKWSWGVRGIYRKLHNAIDDMTISSTGIVCDGEPVSAGSVVGNPGRPITLFTDTNCDGENDAYVTIDTAHAGWALFDDDDNYVGEMGYSKPKRDYKALELMIDRAWDDKWSMNASYTLSFAKGNAEGPVNSDSNFADTGRTEQFDDPFVNYGAVGYLPNDRRHQFKLRGSYALSEQWELGATLGVQSGRPISAIGSGNPFDGTNYWSFFVCTENCLSDVPSERVYELRGRGNEGRTPWLYDLGANMTFRQSFSAADLRVKLSVYNLLNQQHATQVVDRAEPDIGVPNEFYRLGDGYQTPRYATLTFNLDF